MCVALSHHVCVALSHHVCVVLLHHVCVVLLHHMCVVLLHHASVLFNCRPVRLENIQRLQRCILLAVTLYFALAGIYKLYTCALGADTLLKIISIIR